MRLVGTFDREPVAPQSVPDAYHISPEPAEGAAVEPTEEVATGWSREVDLILSAMEAARSSPAERRDGRRGDYRTRAELTLHAQSPLEPPTPLYTRDIDPRGIGFITRERLPLGYGGTISLVLPNGRKLVTGCSVYRCREAISGWYEGALHFADEQPIGRSNMR